MKRVVIELAECGGRAPVDGVFGELGWAMMTTVVGIAVVMVIPIVMVTPIVMLFRACSARPWQRRVSPLIAAYFSEQDGRKLQHDL